MGIEFCLLGNNASNTVFVAESVLDEYTCTRHANQRSIDSEFLSRLSRLGFWFQHPVELVVYDKKHGCAFPECEAVPVRKSFDRRPLTLSALNISTSLCSCPEPCARL